MRPLIGILIFLVTAFLVLAFLGPATISFQRSIEIDAPKDSVYQTVRYFRNFNRWSPWSILDPQMKWSITGTDGNLQSAYHWDGNDQVGKGEMKLVQMQPGESIRQAITFYEPWSAYTEARFSFLELKEGITTVQWQYFQEVPFWQRPLMFFIDIKSSLGKDYDTGLMNLKKVCEEQKKGNIELMI